VVGESSRASGFLEVLRHDKPGAAVAAPGFWLWLSTNFHI
jgi:hypothetical protein